MPGLMLNDELWSKLRKIMLQHKILNLIEKMNPVWDDLYEEICS